jgi:hypothetical protein
VLTRQAKKILLFLSEGNPLWSIVLSPKVTLGKIVVYTGMTNGTFSNWRNGGNQSPDKVEEILGLVRQSIEKPPLHKVLKEDRQKVCRELDQEQKSTAIYIFERFLEAYKDNEVKVYRVATDVLGMSVEQCQQTIDSTIYAKCPLFVSFYYSQEQSETYFRHYQGVYHLWVRRYKRWFQCPLRVRYILKINGQRTVRCKLNFPIVSAQYGEPHWEYDGFILVRENRIFWVFEKRQERRRDQFYFITDDGRGHNGGPLTMSGTYLTAAQDGQQSIVSDDIIMQRLEQGDVNRMEHLMHTTVAIIEGEEARPIERLLKEFRGSNSVDSDTTVG